MAERVVITGIGAVTPAGCDLETHFLKFLAGKSFVTKLEEPFILDVQIAGQCDFDPNSYLSPKDQKDSTRPVWLGVAALNLALKDAGFLTEPRFDYKKTPEHIADRDFKWLGTEYLARRVGIEMGSAVGGSESWRNEKRDSKSIFRLDVSQMVGVPVEIFDIRGPSNVRANACASAIVALGEAYKRVRDGEVDLMIAGGADAPLSWNAFRDFNRMGVLSKRNDEPEKASRPLDQDRDGFIISEAGAMFVLEQKDKAVQRGAHIYAEIKGFGQTTDSSSPFGNNTYATEEAIRLALERSDLMPQDINHIALHAAGTDGDKSEMAAVSRIFSRFAGDIWINTPKSFFGHTMGAAGAVALLETLLEIDNNIIFVNPNLVNPIEEVNRFRRSPKVQINQLRASVINGVGLQGVNASLVITRAT